MRPGAALSGSRKLGVERWMDRKAFDPMYGDARADTELLEYEDSGIHESNVLVEFEVPLATRQLEKQCREKEVRPAQAFDDPLASDVGLRFGVGPDPVLAGRELGSDPMCEEDWVSILGRPTHSAGNGGLTNLEGETGELNIGPSFGPLVSSEGLKTDGPRVGPGGDRGGASEGKEATCTWRKGVDLLKGVGILDGLALPNSVPPEGFQWQFLANVWVLAPVSSIKELGEEGELGGSHVSESEDRVEEYASDESIYEFERSMKELLPGLKVGDSSPTKEVPKSLRKSERHKKPSSRWNEEAGFVAEPPRSTKKKVMSEDSSEGTLSKPLSISDWSNVQLASYCNACGINFVDPVCHFEACVDYICKVENKRSLACVGSTSEQTETSEEVRET